MRSLAPAAGEDVPVEAFMALSEALQTEMFLYEFAPGLTHGSPSIRRSEQARCMAGHRHQITGLNESQVKVYLHRARIQLKNFLVSPENVL